MGKIIGIDISKQTFDVSFKQGSALEHKCYANNLSGFKKFYKAVLKQSDHVVMEASGPYYVQLATYLYSQGVSISVVNPLKIKRFSQMQFNRAKTDKKDSTVIMEYGYFDKVSLTLWQPEAKVIKSLKQLQSSKELLQKQVNQSKNQLSAFEATADVDSVVKSTLRAIIKKFKSSIAKLEQEMLELCQLHYKTTLDALKSIPSIGNKTAIMLIAITDNFTKFDHYKQLIAYVGFSPRVYQSGTSIKGKGHICKMGKSQIRKLLYMCTWTAKKCNKTCAEMYERLQNKGKPERVIKVALANKLLKQAFAIATTNTIYQINHQQKSLV